MTAKKDNYTAAALGFAPAAQPAHGIMLYSDHRCWIIDGDEGKHDYERHFDNRAQAEAAAAEDDTPAAAVSQMRAPCWRATTVCGTQYDDDGEGYLVHFPDRDAAVTQLRLLDYRIDDAGSVRCPYPGHCECDPAEEE